GGITVPLGEVTGPVEVVSVFIGPAVVKGPAIRSSGLTAPTWNQKFCPPSVGVTHDIDILVLVTAPKVTPVRGPGPCGKPITVTLVPVIYVPVGTNGVHGPVAELL